VAEEILRRMAEVYEIGEGADALVVGVTSLAMRDDAGSATVGRSEDGGFVVISTSELGDDGRVRREHLRRLLLGEVDRAGLNAPG
jgi:nucleotide-binding universal stress UspA family protein